MKIDNETLKQKNLDQDYYKKLILDYLKEFRTATRRDFEKLLLNKLPDSLNEQQKISNIRKVLYEMRHQDLSIDWKRVRTQFVWYLVNKPKQNNK